MTKSASNFCEVLVVGAGPSGLMIALNLARFGILVRIVEKEQGKNHLSRAIGVQIRSLEIFQKLGLDKELENESVNIKSIVVDNEFLPSTKINFNFTESCFHQPKIIDQSHTEAILEKALNKEGVFIERGVELVNFSMEKGIVNSLLKTFDGVERKTKSLFLVGADGAHSFVRKKINKKFEGTSYEDAFILADVQLGQKETKKPPVSIFIKNQKLLAVFPMFAANKFRLVSLRRPGQENFSLEPDEQEFQSLLDELAPSMGKITQLNWATRFFVRCLSVRNYQQDKVFLVGDSAHIHSPAGGQGMNTGLQDAYNLAFKLAMVIKGVALEKILLSYNQERKPVGEFLVQNTDRLFSLVSKNSIFLRLARVFMIPALKLNFVRSKFMKVLSQTNIKYKEGLLCSLDHGTIKFSGFTLGKRAPNLLLQTLHNASSIHALSNGLHFSLLILLPQEYSFEDLGQLSDDLNNMFKKFSSLIVCTFISGNKAWAEKASKNLWYCRELSSFEEPFYVVLRPDDHIFCMGEIEQIQHLQDQLLKFLKLDTCYA